jgi:hypothetical protein
VIYFAVGASLFALLVWVGRQPAWRGDKFRLVRALLGALAAVAAVAVGLRGAWIASLGLVAVSIWLGGAARRGAPTAPTSEAMSPAEARSILGVGPEAERTEIEAAYRRLMRRVHPDAGGAEGLAVQLNAARDRLLK